MRYAAVPAIGPYGVRAPLPVRVRDEVRKPALRGEVAHRVRDRSRVRLAEGGTDFSRLQSAIEALAFRRGSLTLVSLLSLPNPCGERPRRALSAPRISRSARALRGRSTVVLPGFQERSRRGRGVVFPLLLRSHIDCVRLLRRCAGAVHHSIHKRTINLLHLFTVWNLLIGWKRCILADEQTHRLAQAGSLVEYNSSIRAGSSYPARSEYARTHLSTRS